MKRKISCVFCGKPRLNNEKIFASDVMENNPNFLCEMCVKKCYIAGINNKESNNSQEMMILKPSQIAKQVQQFVVGQEDAIKELSVIFYNHFRRIKFKDLKINQRFHTLLIGPSGCGKTMIINKMAQLFNVPFVTIDSTTLTAAGYAGEDVDNCVNKLYEMSGKNIEQTECGIIFIDEFDKCKKQNNHGRDVKGEEVQFGFLKLLDGKDVFVNNQKSLLITDSVKINTSNILFIFGGFFEGIDEKCNDVYTSILNSSYSSEYNRSKITPDALIAYGMIPEIVGRINSYVCCNRLKKEDLVEILKNEQNSIIKEYQELLKLDGVNMEFSNDAIELIAELSNKSCGARDLNSIINTVLKDVLFSAPDLSNKNILINKDFILKSLRLEDYYENNLLKNQV